MTRDGNGAHLVIGNRDLNIDALIGHGRGEFVTPLDEAHGAALEQSEKVDVRKLVFFIESIQIEVEERELVSNVLEQDVERRARNLIVNAEACGKALGVLPAPRSPLSTTQSFISISPAITSPNRMVSSSELHRQ